MSHGNSKKIAFIFILVLAACARKSSSPPVAPPPTPEPTPYSTPLPQISPTPSPSPAERENPLASIQSLKPKVNYRRARELIYNDAVINLPLYHFDAVQTHKKAKTKIIFNSGSQLDLGENTFIIIDPKSEEKNPAKDRTVMRKGELFGKTKGELWILTSSALVRIRAHKKHPVASAKVKVSEGNVTQIKLEDGVGEVLVPIDRKNPDEVKELSLIRHKVLTLNAPVVPENYGTSPQTAQWYDDARIVKSKPKEVRPTPAPKPSPSPILKPTPSPTPHAAVAPTLEVSFPPAHYQTSESQIKIQGQTNDQKHEIRINGTTLSADKDGHFTQTFPLNEGINIFVVQLVNADGKSLFKRLIVRRMKPNG